VPNHGVSWVMRHVSGLCADVKLGGGGRRRGEGQVGTCHADGLRAVKDEREA
jgi:hypothetical protein